MEKKLYRATQDRRILGVCGGIAQYLNVDPTVVRMIAVALALSGSGVVFYLIAALIMPESAEF